MGMLVTLSDLKRRFNNDMDEARADGEVVEWQPIPLFLVA